MDIASSHAHVSSWLAKFSEALEKTDTQALKSLFAEDCYWRDLVAFTWNIKTMEGRKAIADMADATLENVRPTNRFGRLANRYLRVQEDSKPVFK